MPITEEGRRKIAEAREHRDEVKLEARKRADREFVGVVREVMGADGLTGDEAAWAAGMTRQSLYYIFGIVNGEES